MLEEITTLAIYHFFLIFCRLGSAFMFMPGFGEVYVNPRSRLVMALAITLVMFPMLTPSFPQELPLGILPFFLAILSEIIIGLFIGAIGRSIQAVLHIAGMIIAFQSSLSSALLFDPTQGSQGSVIGNFITLVGLTMLFASDLHHIIIIGIMDSYTLFEVTKLPFMGDFAEMISKTLSNGFIVAVKISSPLIIIGLLLYLALGIMGRLMPNMQVFFVIVPLQVYISFIMLALTLSAGIMWYLNYFKDTMSILFGE